MRLTCAVLALIAAACDARPAAETKAETSAVAKAESAAVLTLPPLTPDGWGELRIGMTREQVVALAGEDANPNAVGGPDPQSCDEFRPSRAPAGVLVMIEKGTLTRISIGQTSNIVTDRGFGIGTPGETVASTHGKLAVISPHKYLAQPASYITVWSRPPTGPSARGVVYEVNTEGKVFRIHVGGPSIAYVEGCL